MVYLNLGNGVISPSPSLLSLIIVHNLIITFLFIVFVKEHKFIYNSICYTGNLSKHGKRYVISFQGEEEKRKIECERGVRGQ